VTENHTLSELQDIRKHLRSLDGTVRILASSDRPAIRKRIEETFADPRIVIVYRGVQRGLDQAETARELKRRGLADANQPFVSKARAKLQDGDFIEKAASGGGYLVVDGWKPFSLERALRKRLRDAGIDDLL
jgi:hypothetical protein